AHGRHDHRVLEFAPEGARLKDLGVVAEDPRVRQAGRADRDLRVSAEAAQYDIYDGPEADRDEQQRDEVGDGITPLLRLVAALGWPGPRERRPRGHRAHQLTPWVTAPFRSRR